MYLKKRIKTHHGYELGKVFAWLALTTGLGSAAFWTIFPLVADGIFKSEAVVGVFFSFIAFVLFVGSLASTVLFKSVSRVKLIKVSLLGVTVSLLLFTVTTSIITLPFVEVLRALFTLFVGIALSLYVRDTAVKGKLGLAEGRYYLYANIGWLIGPLIGGWLADYVSYNSVFIFSSVLYLISFLIVQHHHMKKHQIIMNANETHILKNLYSNTKAFFKYPELRKVYLIALGLNFWWVLHTIYIPIYIFNNGFSESVVGYVLAGGIIPLILLEKWVGKASDKKGLKLFLTAGFLILAIFIALFQLIPIIALVLILMIVVNVGSALIEPLQETYLFKIIKPKDEERFYGVYNTSDPAANTIGPLVCAALITFGGMAALWYGSAVIMLLLMFVALTVKR